MILADQLRALHVVALVYLSCFHHPILQQYTSPLAFDLVSQHTCQGTESPTVSNLADNLMMRRSAFFRLVSTVDVPDQRVGEG